ncbi:MAG TPA: indole-3-glycerol phosphate synthase TrpC [Ignavibacteriales bacterium]|nr:indole-3-glycerol phosphate synthase TrpC [Ignavibacteriales bacterium]
MNILKQILETKHDEIQFLKKKYSISSFREMEFFNKEVIRIRNLDNHNNNISIIAEIKKASPSKGIIRNDFNHLQIAESYMNCAVEAISILTDEKYFSGNIGYLEQIAQIKNLPLLRKDFIVDEFQIFESKAFGADYILLIAEVLSKTEIKELTLSARAIGLDVLLEIHSSEEIEKIDFDLNKIVGINNRDLKTFNVDIKTTVNLKKLLPSEIFVISESGISTQNDIEILKSNNINGILVGEHLMKSGNVEHELNKLKKWCAGEG